MPLSLRSAPRPRNDRALKPAQLKRLQSRARLDSQGELLRSWLRIFRRTQRTIEARDLKNRKQQLQQEKSRAKMCLAMGLDPYLEQAE